MDDSNLQTRKLAKNILVREDNKHDINNHHNKNLKSHTLKIMLLTCIAASVAMFIYHFLDNSIIYSYLPHIVIIVVFSFLYFRLNRGYSADNISLTAIILYGFILSPPAWFVLTLSHPMIIVIMCFMFIMTILLLENKRQKIVLILMTIEFAGMLVLDGMRTYNEGIELFRVFAGQGIGILITMVMLVYCVWAFKKKYSEMNIELYKHSITDPLTGAYNTRKINDLVEVYTALYKKDKLNFSLTIIDMDNFKIINDTFGHDTGDILLQQTVTIIENNLREGDILARYGGDEFVILLPGCSSIEAKEVVERLLMKIGAINIEDSKGVISFSAGIADACEIDELGSDLFSLADKRMYYSKSKGRNMVSITEVS